jgi:hypothetical protein
MLVSSLIYSSARKMEETYSFDYIVLYPRRSFITTSVRTSYPTKRVFVMDAITLCGLL